MTVNELYKLLLSKKPSKYIIKNEKEIFQLIPELEMCKGFNQNNPWHPYDVYNHILHVVDNVPNNLTIRLAALFHDMGKPETYIEDNSGIGHFYNHWLSSQNIFNEFAIHYDVPNKETISKLIYYHDFNIDKLDDYEKTKFFTKEEMIMLFELKKADLLAQSNKYHYLLNDYSDKEVKIISKFYKKR